jgi:hypothetical protein
MSTIVNDCQSMNIPPEHPKPAGNALFDDPSKRGWKVQLPPEVKAARRKEQLRASQLKRRTALRKSGFHSITVMLKPRLYEEYCALRSASRSNPEFFAEDAIMKGARFQANIGQGKKPSSRKSNGATPLPESPR